jgi:hypothetical protein
MRVSESTNQKNEIMVKFFTTYESWENSVHERVKTEPIWAFLGYRIWTLLNLSI